MKCMKAIQVHESDKITQNPGDYLEWRVANLRLNDMWLLPMLQMAPRSLAIWVRFVNENTADTKDSGSKESAFEKADDPFDSTSLPVFWGTLVFCSVLPAFQGASCIRR